MIEYGLWCLIKFSEKKKSTKYVQETVASTEVYEDFADTHISWIFLQPNITKTLTFPFSYCRCLQDTDSEWQADSWCRLVIPLHRSLRIHMPVSAKMSHAICVRTD